MHCGNQTLLAYLYGLRPLQFHLAPHRNRSNFFPPMASTHRTHMAVPAAWHRRRANKLVLKKLQSRTALRCELKQQHLATDNICSSFQPQPFGATKNLAQTLSRAPRLVIAAQWRHTPTHPHSSHKRTRYVMPRHAHGFEWVLE